MFSLKNPFLERKPRLMRIFKRKSLFLFLWLCFVDAVEVGSGVSSLVERCFL